MDRTSLGQTHFNEPVMEMCGKLKNTIERQKWQDFNPDPIVHYYESMLSGSLPDMINESLDEEDIADLEPDQVKVFSLLLMRDMFRRNHKALRPDAKDRRWVEAVFKSVAKQEQLPPEVLKDDGKPYDLKDEDAAWAGSMSALMGLPAADLVRSQSKAILDVKEALAAEPEGIVEADLVEAEVDEAGAADGGMIGEEFDEDEEYVRRKGFIGAAPPWLVSSLLHGLIIMLLALVTLDPVQLVKNVLTVNPADEVGEEMEEFALEQIDPDEMVEETLEEPVAEMPTMVQAMEAIEIESPDGVLNFAVEMPDMAEAIAPLDSLTQTLTSAMTNATTFSSRSTDAKKEMLKKYGGSEATEAAVQNALDWFARHQLRSGAWSLHHGETLRGCNCKNPADEKGNEGYNGATALAILPFLGAGQTHIKGKYKKNVHGGLMFLAQNMKKKMEKGVQVGDLRDKSGNMYSHCLATIALSEAYAMTGDPELAPFAQWAINYLVLAQNTTGGGWRYSPGQPGDTSVVGWAVMALKSAHMGHLVVPPNSVKGASLFLDRVQDKGGVYYGYDKPSTKPSTTAVGLLCRMYLGWKKDNPALKKGVAFLAKTGYKTTDAYYNYYAAQVLRQAGGPEWETYNGQMSKILVDSQAVSGHEKGSWYFNSGHTGARGGRMAITSLCTMTLEVYYRHLPLYAEKVSEDDFEL